MPDTATLPAPAAATAPVVAAPPPPAPVTAKEGFFKALDKKAGIVEAPVTAPAEKKVEAKVKPAKTEAAPVTASDKLPEPSGDKTAAEAASPKEEKPKTNPWKLVEDYKGKLANAETELASLKGKTPDPKQLEQLQARVQELDKANAELEAEMRFHNFKKTKHYQETYEKPYQERWKLAMSNLSEIPVTDPDGKVRPLTPRDIEEIVNMPLAEAKARATDKFGEFADDVLSERKEIRRLWSAQAEAVEKARVESETHEKGQLDQWQKRNGELRQELGDEWAKANEAAIKHEKFGRHFTPVEGDEEGNTALERGYKLVDEANSVNPGDPRLDKDQRIMAIKKLAAVRNRAAAFGRLTLQVQRAEKRIAELETELKQYQETTPEVAGQTTSAAPVQLSARDQVFGAIDKRARPA